MTYLRLDSGFPAFMKVVHLGMNFLTVKFQINWICVAYKTASTPETDHLTLDSFRDPICLVRLVLKIPVSVLEVFTKVIVYPLSFEMASHTP